MYQVLARKWRPNSFQNMVGQEATLRILSNALEQKRLHHAYLLTGTRGVGKTTLARILAKCLNCESGITPTPCETCHTCQAIAAGQFLDLYEIDAASRTKVEDTRDLLDNVLYPPTQGRYKIYLIDEVHMLSNHSFNALLKTLEEPPEHVKFVLATTDPKRLPITILSRCLQFHLKRIPPEQIAAHLQHICNSESIPAEVPALEKLAHAADGSMRDALSLLDQAIAYGHGNVTKTDVYAMLGSLAQDDLLPLLDALATSSGPALFTAIKSLAERAPDFQQILEDLISILHRLAIQQIVPDAISLEPAITPFVSRFTPEQLQLYYQIALLGRRDLAIAPSPQQGFEMTMLRMLAFQPNATTAIAAPVTTAPTVKPTTPPPVQAAPPSAPTPPPPPAATTASSSLNWRDMLPKLGLTGMAYALAANCTLAKMDDQKVELALAPSHQPMLNAKLKERITQALTRYLNRAINLEMTITSEDINTPQKQQKSEHETLLATATQRIMQDPKVQELIDLCDATVEVALV